MMRDLSLFFIQPQAYLISEIFFSFFFFLVDDGDCGSAGEVLKSIWCSLSLFFFCLVFQVLIVRRESLSLFISCCLCAVGNLLFFFKNEIFALCYARDASWTNCGHCGQERNRQNDKGRQDSNSNQMSKGVPFLNTLGSASDVINDAGGVVNMRPPTTTRQNSMNKNQKGVKAMERGQENIFLSLSLSFGWFCQKALGVLSLLLPSAVASWHTFLFRVLRFPPEKNKKQKQNNRISSEKYFVLCFILFCLFVFFLFFFFFPSLPFVRHAGFRFGSDFHEKSIYLGCGSILKLNVTW